MRRDSTPSELPSRLEILEAGRWTLLPEYAGADAYIEDADGSKRIVASGLRLRKRSDGALEHSSDFMPAEGIRAVPLPDRVGGGVLFIGERGGETLLWRAESWTGKLKPLARISDRVEDIQVGFDRLYLDLPLAHRWGALDLETGAVAELAPLPDAPGYSSMAFADSWFGAVTSDVVGVLVTFDAGASWHPISGVARDARLQVQDGDIVIGDDRDQYRLTAQGDLRRYASASGQELFTPFNESALGPPGRREDLRSTPLLPRLERALHDAVLYGWPLADGHAVVATEGAVSKVRLTDGTVTRSTNGAYSGDRPCTALALGSGIGFACNESPRGTSLYEFVPPLSLKLVERFAATRAVHSSGNGALAISGRCDPESEYGASGYCLRHIDGKFSELRVRGDAGVERVVVRRNGSVLLLVPPRLGAAGTLTTIVDGKQSTTSLRLPKDEFETAFLETGMWLNEAVEVEGGGFGTWVAGSRGYRGVTVQPDGTVRSHAPPDGGSVARAVFHGPIAFEASPSGLCWVSTDLGNNWVKLEAPPGFYPLEERTSLATLGPAPEVGCSRVGCAYGAWLRIGFPKTDEGVDAKALDGGVEPSQESEDGAEPGALVEADLPPRVNFNPGSFFNWSPSCFATGELGPSREEVSKKLNQLSREGPRRGLMTGFLPPLTLATPIEQQAAVFRPFEGIPGPTVGDGTIRFDHGSDSEPSFRAYAWGNGAAQWSGSSAWQVRVASTFGDARVWASAPTVAPWPDAQVTAELFGSSEGTRSGADWTLELDPAEDGALLRIGAGMTAELHVLAPGRATMSYGSVSGGRLQGAVKVNGEWYFAQHDGDEFRVFRLAATGPLLVGTYALRSSLRATLVKTSDSRRLGLFIRSRPGSWHLYPIDDRFEPESPLSVDREALNAVPSACGANAEGWLVVVPAPLSRVDTGAPVESIQFAESLPGFRARGLTTKLLVRDGSVCIEELATTLTHKGEPSQVPSRSSRLAPGQLPMVVTDPFLGRHVGFRCSL